MLGVSLDAIIFWYGLPSYDGVGENYHVFQTYFLSVLFFVLILWGVKLLICSGRNIKFVRTRELYGGSSFLLSAIAFWTIGLKLLFMFGETQDIIRGIVLVIISLLGSITLAIATINGRIYTLSSSRKREKQRMIPAALATSLILISSVMGVTFARTLLSSARIEATEYPLVVLTIFTVLCFIFSWLGTMSYYQIYLQYKFKLLDMKA